MPFHGRLARLGNLHEQFCTTQVQTVWYSFTATSDTVLHVDLAGSDFGVVINVYQVSSGDPGTLDFIACQGSFGSLYVSAEQGVTYYFQVGSAVQGSLGMSLTVDEVPPPVNDQFADATPVLETPFTVTVEKVIAATVEPDEPFPARAGPCKAASGGPSPPPSTAYISPNSVARPRCPSRSTRAVHLGS